MKNLLSFELENIYKGLGIKVKPTKLIDRVGKDKTARFLYYNDGNLWYACEDGFEFPIPVGDAGTGYFKAEEKALLLMRWVRQHMEFLQNCYIEAGAAKQ